MLKRSAAASILGISCLPHYTTSPALGSGFTQTLGMVVPFVVLLLPKWSAEALRPPEYFISHVWQPGDQVRLRRTILGQLPPPAKHMLVSSCLADPFVCRGPGVSGTDLWGVIHQLSINDHQILHYLPIFIHRSSTNPVGEVSPSHQQILHSNHMHGTNHKSHKYMSCRIGRIITSHELGTTTTLHKSSMIPL